MKNFHRCFRREDFCFLACDLKVIDSSVLLFQGLKAPGYMTKPLARLIGIKFYFGLKVSSSREYSGGSFVSIKLKLLQRGIEWLTASRFTILRELNIHLRT